MSDGPFYQDDDLDWSFKPILIPVIRKVSPSTIASEIVGVQPMSDPTLFKSNVRYKWNPDYMSLGPDDSVEAPEPTLVDLIYDVFK